MVNKWRQHHIFVGESDRIDGKPSENTKRDKKNRINKKEREKKMENKKVAKDLHARSVETARSTACTYLLQASISFSG